MWCEASRWRGEGNGRARLGGVIAQSIRSRSPSASTGCDAGSAGRGKGQAVAAVEQGFRALFEAEADLLDQRHPQHELGGAPGDLHGADDARPLFVADHDAPPEKVQLM